MDLFWIFHRNFSVMGEERRPRGTGGEGRRHQVVHTILHLAQGGGITRFADCVAHWHNCAHIAKSGVSILSKMKNRDPCVTMKRFKPFFSGGGGGRLVGCGCSGDICKKYFAKIFLHTK